MIFGYARVSTKTQARDGNSLDAQQAALTAAGAEKIYTDTFTGTKIERPEFDRLRAQLRRGGHRSRSIRRRYQRTPSRNASTPRCSSTTPTPPACRR